jgi:DNA sulfur modification protein DndD
MKSERVKALLSERDTLQKDITDINLKIAEKRGRFRELMAQAWRWFLNPRVNKIVEAVNARAEELRAKETEFAVATESLKLIDAAIASGSCESCKRSLDTETLNTFKQRAESLREILSKKPSPTELTSLLQRLATLKEFLTPDLTAVAKELTITLEDLRVDKATKEDRMGEIREQTLNIDESEIRKLASEHDRMGQDLALLDLGIKAEGQKIIELSEDIRRVQEELNKKGGAALAKERARREMCDNLVQLFDQAVGEYRDKLRSKVEEDATSLFLSLTTESDYLKLSINENYGLTIVHKDGAAIPVRSAGAEHIVALSLMGALQHNAPLRGPIIMDSPFGRLDQGHTTRVVRTLPSMADQVLLLIYEAELEPQLARNELKAKLQREYQLVRKTARHSLIQPFTE